MNEFAARRQRLLDQIDANALVVVASNQEVQRNGDAYYRFRQDSDFYYLTGFNEPDAIMVLLPQGDSHEYFLYNRQRDPLMETWNGRRAGQEGAVLQYGADESYSIEDFFDHLPDLLVDRLQVYYPIGHSQDLDDMLMEAVNELRRKVRSGVTAPQQFSDVSPLIHEMRLFKSETEIELMRKAAKISVDAHINAMKIAQPGVMEYELQAEIEYTFLKHGCSYPAYSSIVGNGANGCILHYIENSDVLKDGDLVLIDAGGEYKNYAADITRTFPANGKFTESQRLIYELVLKAQTAALAQLRPGITWNAIQKTIIEIYVEGLLDLGLLSGDKRQLIQDKAYQQFYMHKSGHWIGMDVHDVGAYKIDHQWRTLEPGMAFTVEPGLYIAAESPGVDQRWWDIGIRIEDNVLITESGYELLTDGLPRTIEEIEALMEG